jgi:hypothetical protein
MSPHIFGIHNLLVLEIFGTPILGENMVQWTKVAYEKSTQE